MSYYIDRLPERMYKNHLIEHLPGTRIYKVYNENEIMVDCTSTLREARRHIDRMTERKGE